MKPRKGSTGDLVTGNWCDGFTLIEVLVGGIILVIAIGLIAVLYGKAGRIRTIVASQNQVQLTLSSMLDTIRTGAGHNLESLAFATKIYSEGELGAKLDRQKITFFSANNPTNPYVHIEIDTTAANETVYRKVDGSPIWPGSFDDLDINKKIDIIDTPTTISRFYYYSSETGSSPHTEEEITDFANSDEVAKISKVIVCLVGRSTMGAIQKTVTLYSTIRLRNINPL